LTRLVAMSQGGEQRGRSAVTASAAALSNSAGILAAVGEAVPANLDNPPGARQLRYPQGATGYNLAGPSPRYHPHFTPTNASRLNQVERWFALLAEKEMHPVHTRRACQ
jgi:hypothetical protein